jgi:hypothetical protein
MVYWYQGRRVAAEAALDTLLGLSEWDVGYVGRSYFRWQKGDVEGALADVQQAERLGNRPGTFRAMVEIMTGDSTFACGIVEGYDGLDDQTRAFNSIYVARLCIVLGRHDDALALLEEWPHELSTWAVLHDPIFEPLYDNPRYIRLLEASRPEGR